MSKKFILNWRVPLLLLLYGGMNVLFDAMQLGNIQQGPPVNPDEFTSMHYFETPLPIVSHILAGIIFNLMSPFQFAPTILRRWPKWHRGSGRLLIGSGLIVGVTGLWMNHYFPAYGGILKYTGVVAHSVGLIMSLGISLRLILKREIRGHRAWIMRAVACGLGPATQRLIILPIFFIYGTVNESLVGLVVWAGVLINLAVVERILWRERKDVLKQIKPILKEVL